MQKTHESPLAHRSELQRQLELVGDILKPFLTLKTEDAIEEKYYTTRRKLWPEDKNEDYFHFWNKLYVIFCV